MEVLARFAGKDEKLEEKGYKKVPSELGHVYLPPEQIEFGDILKLGFTTYFQMPQITVEGCRSV